MHKHFKKTTLANMVYNKATEIPIVVFSMKGPRNYWHTFGSLIPYKEKGTSSQSSLDCLIEAFIEFV